MATQIILREESRKLLKNARGNRKMKDVSKLCGFTGAVASCIENGKEASLANINIYSQVLGLGFDIVNHTVYKIDAPRANAPEGCVLVKETPAKDKRNGPVETYVPIEADQKEGDDWLDILRRLRDFLNDYPKDQATRILGAPAGAVEAWKAGVIPSPENLKKINERLINLNELPEAIESTERHIYDEVLDKAEEKIRQMQAEKAEKEEETSELASLPFTNKVCNMILMASDETIGSVMRAFAEDISNGERDFNWTDSKNEAANILWIRLSSEIEYTEE